MRFSGQAGYKPDYLYLMQRLMMDNPEAAVNLAKMIAKQPGPPIDLNTLADLFLQRNAVREATAFLLDVLQENKPEHDKLQTKVGCATATCRGPTRAVHCFHMGGSQAPFCSPAELCRSSCLSMTSCVASVGWGLVAHWRDLGLPAAVLQESQPKIENLQNKGALLHAAAVCHSVHTPARVPHCRSANVVNLSKSLSCCTLLQHAIAAQLPFPLGQAAPDCCTFKRGMPACSCWRSTWSPTPRWQTPFWQMAR